MDLLRWLPYQGAKYATIVAYYYVLHRGQVCCVSTNHAARAAAKTIVKGTFADPVHVLSTTVVLVPPMSPPPIAPPPPTPPSAGSSAAPAAAPPPTPATTVTSSQSRYVENYEVVEECVSEFYTLIAETVEDEETMNEILEEIGSRDGVLLLKYWAKKFKNDASSTIFGEIILENMRKIEAVGLTTASVAEFNIFKRILNDERKLLPATDPCSDISFASKLVSAVRNLGPLVRTELNNAMRIDGSRGDLKKTKLTIISVLSELEEPTPNDKAMLGTTDPRTGDRGGGRGKGAKGGRGGDRGVRSGGRGGGAPATPTITHADRPWAKADGYCRWCAILGLTPGEHWNANCKKIAEAKAKKAAEAAEKTAKPAGKGLLSRGGELCLQADDDDDDNADDYDEDEASIALFTSGKPALLNVNDLDSLQGVALLQAIAAGGESSGAPPPEDTASAGKAHMARVPSDAPSAVPLQSSDDEDAPSLIQPSESYGSDDSEAPQPDDDNGLPFKAPSGPWYNMSPSSYDRSGHTQAAPLDLASPADISSCATASVITATSSNATAAQHRAHAVAAWQKAAEAEAREFQVQAAQIALGKPPPAPPAPDPPVVTCAHQLQASVASVPTPPVFVPVITDDSSFMAAGDMRARTASPRRVYVVAPSLHDDLGGVYYGTWFAPDFVSRFVSGRSAAGLTCKRIKPDTIVAAVQFITSSNMDIKWFRGPCIHNDHPALLPGHSTSGFVFMLCEAAISWSSKRQVSVALSSCEAEIVAGSEAAKEAVHLSGLASEYNVAGSDPMDVFMDNESGIKVAYNPEHFGRMKHVDRRHFYIRECVENHKLRVPYVSTVDNLADFFTKCQPPDLFFKMRDTIMNVDSSVSATVPAAVG